MKHIFTLSFLFFCLFAFAQIPPRPEPATYVNDYTGKLTKEEQRKLEQQLLAWYKESSNQFVLVMIDKLPESKDIESYANQWFNSWGIGEKGKDNGVLLLIALSDRKIRIEVGYGLESSIPDAVAAQIIDLEIAPRFRKNDYSGGINAAFDNLKAACRGSFKKLPDPDRESYWKYILPFSLLLPFLVVFYQRNGLDAFKMRKGLFPLLIILAVSMVFLNILLWDKEIALGYLILRNLSIWFGIICAAMGAYMLYRIYILFNYKTGLFYWGRLFTAPLLLFLLWNYSPLYLYHKTIPQLAGFLGFHAVCYIIWVIFKRQSSSILSIYTVNDNFDLSKSHWEKVLMSYRRSDIENKINVFRRKLMMTPLYNYAAFNKQATESYQFYTYPAKYFRERADRDLQEANASFADLGAKYFDAHRKALQKELSAAVSKFEGYAEMPEMPADLRESYEKAAAYWKSRTDERNTDSFYMKYQVRKALYNDSDWLAKSKQFQQPEAILKVFRSCQAEFMNPDTVRDFDTFEALYQQHKLLLQKSENELPKRNDLILIPAIEQVHNKGILKDPIYLEKDRKKYQDLAEKEKEYFEKYACSILSESDAERLKKSIEIFQSLFNSPIMLLGHDTDFLKKQLKAAKELDWSKYNETYTAESITKAKENLKTLIFKAEKKDQDVNALIAVYRFFAAIPSNLSVKTVSAYTYNSGSSSSGSSSSYKSSYSDYKDYSDYRDYSDSYSDSSFGGGSSGGGGASGGW